MAPTWIFWGLDGYYLSLERRYRQLFASVAQQLRDPAATGLLPFDMTPVSGRPARDFARAIVTPSVAAIPAVLTALIIGYRIVTIIND
ncbi:hypothetical protein ACFZC5_20555 [Nocardia gamkensis]|uniref:hypothetical protein n=1 Tax=Nocardia gamkensis TaxID=352869 RepID=UPI0036ED1CFE